MLNIYNYFTKDLSRIIKDLSRIIKEYFNYDMRMIDITKVKNSQLFD
jgi:hypothetical protein